MTQYRFTRHACVLITAGILTMTACGGGKDSSSAEPESTPSETSAEPSPQGEDTEVKKNVLRAYDGFWREQVKAYAKGSSKGTDLGDYATAQALSETNSDLMQLKKAGTVVKGKPGHDAEVTVVDTKAKTPKATVKDCLDISQWQTVESKTGKVLPHPSEQPPKYYTIATVERWEGKWLVTQVETQNAC